MFDGELISLNENAFAFLMLDLSALYDGEANHELPVIEWEPIGNDTFILANNPDEPATLQLASAPPGELHWVA